MHDVLQQSSRPDVDRGAPTGTATAHTSSRPTDVVSADVDANAAGLRLRESAAVGLYTRHAVPSTHGIGPAPAERGVLSPSFGAPTPHVPNELAVVYRW